MSRLSEADRILYVFAIDPAKASQSAEEMAVANQAPQKSCASKGAALGGIKRAILLVVGTTSLAAGIAGIFVPILPTTPFLLLSAACYLRSSRRFYHWLTSNRLVGEYIRNYMERRGVTLRLKVCSLTLLWTTIGCSAAFATDTLWIRILLAVIAVAVTAHILSLRTLSR